MAYLGILWPTFALIALIWLVWFTLIFQRAGHMRRHPPTGDIADKGAARDYFAPVARPSDNLANLFELPVLYFALVPLLMLTRHANHLQVLLAWCFVVARAIHSALHIGGAPVGTRFLAYLVSCIVLLAMWAGFAIDMITIAATSPVSL